MNVICSVLAKIARESKLFTTFTIFVAALVARPVLAQGNWSFGQTLGSLDWSYTTAYKTCVYNGRYVQYTVWTYKGFTYTPYNGSPQSLGGLTATFTQSPGGLSCPKAGASPNPLVLGNGYTIDFFATGSGQGNASISIPGYINPKYVVVGVTYAPPGPSSSVDYTKSTAVSNSSDSTKTFGSGWTKSVSFTRGIGIQGWFNGSVTQSATTSYSQTSYTSTSVTVSKTTSVSDSNFGPTNPYTGLNHDYDIIWVWLNPVALFTVGSTPSSYSMQSNGFGYSTMDQPAMDIYPVYVGWLNGDIPMPSDACVLTGSVCTQGHLARIWALKNDDGSAQGFSGPASSQGTDLHQIMLADPYWDCTPNPSSCPTVVNLTRYAPVSADQDFVYQQAPVGGQPITQGYTDGYSVMTAQGQGASYTFSQSFATEANFTFFKPAFEGGLQTQYTYMSESQWDKNLQTTTSSDASLSITGPPCNVVNNACSPVYPPSNPLYGQATEFDVYQDNLYGTFLFVPVSY